MITHSRFDNGFGAMVETLERIQGGAGAVLAIRISHIPLGGEIVIFNRSDEGPSARDRGEVLILSNWIEGPQELGSFCKSAGTDCFHQNYNYKLCNMRVSLRDHADQPETKSISLPAWECCMAVATERKRSSYLGGETIPATRFVRLSGSSMSPSAVSSKIE